MDFWRPRGVLQPGQLWRRPPGNAVVSGFTPADLPDLLAWYDATAGVYSDAGSTPANNNDTVRQWNDQSGNGYHLKQATSGSRPTYKTSSINSLPGLEFSEGGADWMNTDVDSVALSSNAHSCFVVAELVAPSGGSFNRMVGYLGNGQANDFNNASSCLWFFVPSSETVNSFANSGYRGSALSVSNGSPARLGSVFDGTNVTTYKNNTGTTPTAYNQTLSNNGTILLNTLTPSGGSYSSIKFSEIIILSDGATSTERDDIDAYLSAKWGF